MPVRGVLWDVGNVIVGWNPRRLYSKIFPDPAACDDFLSRVCTLAWHHNHDLGMSFEANAAPLIAAHPQHEAAIRAWGGRFIEMVGPPIPETEAVIAELAARGVPQFGLTNMPQSKWPEVRALSPAFTYLRDTVVSGEHGVAKPDPAIFELACTRTGMRPEELLFIDDSAANVAVAEAMGFQVHHFTGPAALRPTLGGPGLL